MPRSGLAFEKEEDGLTKRVLDFFERTRFAYLSAKEDPSEYGKKWKNIVKKIREDFDQMSNFAQELKEYVTEKILFDDDVYDAKSGTAETLFKEIKEMRFKSEKISDPFSKLLGDDVIDTFMEKPDVFISFIHYALRSHSNKMPDKIYESQKLKPDQITQGTMGLDLKVEDIPLYIIEHYGAEGKDTRRVKSKFKSSFSRLKEMYNETYPEDKWDALVDLDVVKAEKSEEEKQEVDFIIPNKPMYRIFETDDLKQLKGFSGEWLVQEKYDGMRIQIHKDGDSIKIYSFNKKDITDKCPLQVKEMEKKNFGDCILDAELTLFLDDEPLHRADTVAHVFKKETKGRLSAHVFDIMKHEGKMIADEPLRERVNILFYQYSSHSTENLAFPSKKDTRIADSIKEVEDYSKVIMELPSSEGVVIKDIESTYIIGKQKNPKWIKWKKFVDLDVVVLGSKKTASGLYSYTMGIGPVNAETARTYKTTELGDKAYLSVGKALNTKEKVDVGDIVRVKVDEVKKGKDGFSLYSAKVIEIPEVTESDKVETLEQLSTKTKKSLDSAIEFIAGKAVGDRFKVMSGVQNATKAKTAADVARDKKKKKVKKGYYITDDIHGTAEIILKSDLDGFTIYGFSGDDLMQKNALYNIDIWKEQVTQILKTKRSELRVGIRNDIIEHGDDPKPFDKILDFVEEHYKDTYEELFEMKPDKLMSWLKRQEDIQYVHPNKFQARDDVLEKDIEELKKKDTPNQGKFKLFQREDGNIDFVIRAGGEKMAWTIDIEDTEDVFNLFGKSGKFPAIVATTVNEEKLLDAGDLELGVQKDGYHEYRLDGDKFQTRMHVRVVPLDEQKTWLAWTGKKQEMLDKTDDDGVWMISEDKYADLPFPKKNSE
tara:strand:+ start:2161 stop:4803 length:2643 start_codon:yes stop_codon:yes gene_type:complete